jgi:putative FmdB family regulatory protein
VPTYQYACTECGHAFEQFQSFSDDALTECPQCQGRLRKLFNAVGVVFKGSGFYRNDSRADSSSGTSTEKTSTEKPAEKSTEKSGSAEKSSGPATAPAASSSPSPAAAS